MNVFLTGSAGTGKTLLLVEILKMYLAHFKLKGVKTKALVITYDNGISENGRLVQDLKTKHLSNVVSDTSIKVMTFREACTGKIHTFKMVVVLGVELNWNSFEICSIRKFAIRLIRKGKKYSKNSMKINSKFVRFDSTPTIGWSQIFQMLNLFEIRSILKFMIRLIRR